MQRGIFKKCRMVLYHAKVQHWHTVHTQGNNLIALVPFWQNNMFCSNKSEALWLYQTCGEIMKKIYNDEGLDTNKRVKFSVENSKVASAKFLCYEELVHLAARRANKFPSSLWRHEKLFIRNSLQCFAALFPPTTNSICTAIFWSSSFCVERKNSMVLPQTRHVIVQWEMMSKSLMKMYQDECRLRQCRCRKIRWNLWLLRRAGAQGIQTSKQNFTLHIRNTMVVFTDEL